MTRLGVTAVTVVALVMSGSCFDVILLRPELRAAVSRRDAVGLADALEQLIEEERATIGDREAAYDAVRGWRRPTADYAYARAALAGRLAQVRGLSATGLVRETEALARASMALDPNYRNGAARRMLGTLYVLAPAQLLAHGDSEAGLELLEAQLAAYPRDPQNRVRLAEGYLSLNDVEPAREHLCAALRDARDLKASEHKLLATLVEQAGGSSTLTCD
ncbi:MAG: hypothetical protein EXR75_04525 [Myxococcales bacterium]|nr:hypothetical protein [Myxococcales bacterium]